MPDQLHASIRAIALVLTHVPPQLGNTAAKAKTEAKRLMWSEEFLGMFQWGVIYQMHAETTIRALHPDFVFRFSFSASICQV